MLKLVVLVGMVALAVARPQQLQFTLGAQPGAQVVAAAPAVPAVNPTHFVNTNNPDGSAAFGFQTLDGQSRTESVGIDGSRRGSYSYTDANGQPVNVYYIADAQGYRTSPTPFPAAPAAPVAAPAPAPQPQAAFPQFSFFQPQQAQPGQFTIQTLQPHQIQHHHQITTPAPVTAPPAPAAVQQPAVAETHQAQQAFQQQQAFNPFVPTPFGLLGFQQFGAQPGQSFFAGRR